MTVDNRDPAAVVAEGDRLKASGDFEAALGKYDEAIRLVREQDGNLRYIRMALMEKEWILSKLGRDDEAEEVDAAFQRLERESIMGKDAYTLHKAGDLEGVLAILEDEKEKLKRA